MRLKITTHSGETMTVEETTKTIAEIDEQRNDDQLQSVLIGDVSFSRIDLKNILPVPETETPAE